MQCLRQALGIFYNRLFYFLTDRRSRIYGNTVSGVHTGTLNMLHNTGDKNICSITYGINFDFLTLQIFIYKNWMILRNTVDDTNKFFDFFIIESNLHALSTKYVRRTNKYRIS